jgi:type I restriction enzyme S subunit
LDDKIELNRKMNETLEQMAKALFKSWFVDFDPVYAKAAGRHPAGMDRATADLFPESFVDSELGKIPKGWRPTTIGNCCERIFSGGTPNTSNRSFWDGDIPWLSSGETRESFITQTEKFITKAGVENSSTRHARKGCTAIASAGQGHTRGQTSMLTGDFYINQSVVALESKKGASTDLFNYFTMERRYEELRQLSDSNSSRGSLTTKLVAQMSVVLPPAPLLSAFDKFAIPLVELIVKNASQTRSICAIRDSLLPQLLAGSNNSQHLNIT